MYNGLPETSRIMKYFNKLFCNKLERHGRDFVVVKFILSKNFKYRMQFQEMLNMITLYLFMRKMSLRIAGTGFYS